MSFRVVLPSPRSRNRDSSRFHQTRRIYETSDTLFLVYPSGRLSGRSFLSNMFSLSLSSLLFSLSLLRCFLLRATRSILRNVFATTTDCVSTPLAIGFAMPNVTTYQSTGPRERAYASSKWLSPSGGHLGSPGSQSAQ